MGWVKVGALVWLLGFFSGCTPGGHFAAPSVKGNPSIPSDATNGPGALLYHCISLGLVLPLSGHLPSVKGEKGDGKFLWSA